MSPIDAELVDAKTYYISTYAQGRVIDGQVLLGADSYDWYDLTLDDLLSGTGNGDLILGKSGRDTIHGLGGDGRIVIVDTVGAEVESRPLGNFFASGANEWKLLDGSTIRITHNSPWIIVFADGGSIDPGENFQSGDFGIFLRDAPADPVTTATIYGSPDAIEDEKLGPVYRMKSSLERTAMRVDGKEVPVAPGMSGSVEVKTGKRQVIEFFLSPIIKSARESLTLR